MAETTVSLIEIATPLVLAIGAGSFGLWRYLTVRRRELAWKRTEFMFLQGHYLDTNKDLSEIVQIVEERHNNVTLDQLLDKKSTLDKTVKNLHLAQLDKFLNLFDRLYYAVHSTETLTIEEIQPVSWYLTMATKNHHLHEYCQNYGFKDVLKFAEESR